MELHAVKLKSTCYPAAAYGLPRTIKAQPKNARKRAVQIQLRLHALAACRNQRDHDLLDQATDRLARVAIRVGHCAVGYFTPKDAEEAFHEALKHTAMANDASKD